MNFGTCKFPTMVAEEVQTVKNLIQFTEMLQDHLGPGHILTETLEKNLIEARKMVL